MWLRNKLGIDSKSELQTSETRLIQFCGMVDAVVRQILNLNRIPVGDNNYHHYVELENRIMKSILPVKERLQDRLNESRNDPSDAQALVHHDRQSQPQSQPQPQPQPQPQCQPSMGPSSSSTDCWAQPNNNYDSEFAAYAQTLQNRLVPAHLSSVEDFINQPVENVFAQSGGGGKGCSIDEKKCNDVGSSKNEKAKPTKKISKVSSTTAKKGKGSADGDSVNGVKKLTHNSLFPPASPKSITVTNSCRSLGGSVSGGSSSSLASASSSVSPALSQTVPSPPGSGDETYAATSARDVLVCAASSKTTANVPLAGNKRQLDSAGGEKTSAQGVEAVTSKPASSEMCSLLDDEGVRNPSRRRRRISQLVPFPRKPRGADYTCTSCSEGYHINVVENPWWAVFRHDCPHCKASQIPRIDINLASNAIELDPNVTALYGEGMEDSDGDYDDDEDGSDEEDGDEEGSVAGDDREAHPFDGEGLLAQEQASKLLVLMSHARTCSGIHASPKHAEICRSTKYLMLHIRDCNGTDVHGRPCQFPWCLPCKKMLRHLTHCYEPGNCKVCNPWNLPESLKKLRALNQLRTPKVSDAILKKLPVPGSKPANASGASTPATPPVVPGGSGPPGGSTIAGPGKESLLAACQPCSAH
jgi:hypothetical protein